MVGMIKFSEGRVAPTGAKIVYVDGAFDLFHPGHVDFLKVRPPTHMKVKSKGKGPSAMADLM